MPRRKHAKVQNAAWIQAVVLFGFVLVAGPADSQEHQDSVVQGERVHGIAMHGGPALTPGFSHFPYVNPDAPKGGQLRIGQLGSFDSLNPFLPRGVSPSGLRGYVYESLLARSDVEPFSLYGLLAEAIAVPEDRSRITFFINPKARFSDGAPVTAEDVAFSHGLLKDQAWPYMRSHYGKVSEVIVSDPRTITFVFAASGDREIPLIMGLMPILPKHAMSVEAFKATSFQSPIGSGPMVIGSVDPGRSLTFERNPDYWARDLPTRRGLYNFDEFRIEYFRNDTSLFEAFRAGAIDVRIEDDPVKWAKSYEFPALKDGRAVREALPVRLPAGMLGVVMNTRRQPLAEQNVRKALIRLFDFEWVNRTLFNGLYERTQSYFARSDLAAVGRVASPREREWLAPFGDLIAKSILDGTWSLEQGGGTGQDRAALRDAMALFKRAGFKVADGKLVAAETGRPLAFEFLARTKSEERLMLAYQSVLKRLGISLSIRQVDDSQYWARLKSFDFDLLMWRYSASLSPGNEQINRWASSHASIEGSLNLAGARNPAVDAMIEQMLAAVDRDVFEDAVRAFDRALIAGDYLIPLFHPPAAWVAYWAKLKRPQTLPNSGIALETWWQDPNP